MNSTKNCISVVLILCFFSIPMLPVQISFGAEADKLKIGKLTETMMCLCGCGQTIKNCPHVNCGFAIPARKRMATLLAEGKSVTEILEIYLKQYGDEILAAPQKKGFNLIGYIMPFVAIFIAAGAIFMVLRSWAAKGMKA